MRPGRSWQQSPNTSFASDDREYGASISFSRTAATIQPPPLAPPPPPPPPTDFLAAAGVPDEYRQQQLPSDWEAPLDDWAACTSDGLVASKEDVFGIFIADLVEDGDLEMSEAEEIWAQTLGAGATEVDEAAFGRFWHGIEVLVA